MNFRIKTCLVALFALLFAGILAAHADDVKVTAALSDPDTQVGESVDFTITVQGVAEARVSQNIDVDGLTITYEGPYSSQSFVINSSGAHSVSSIVQRYSVVPTKSGEFVIPPQEVIVDGNTYKTQPVTLKVGGDNSTAAGGAGNSGGNGNAAGAGADDAGSGKLFYAEIVAPSHSGYIGETLPFEIRLYVDGGVRTQLEEMPEITAQGCTLEKMTKPEQSQVERNGRTYIMVTYKSAVTPAKAGTLTLGPISVQALAQIPERRPRRQAGGLDDPLMQNPFFDDALRMMSEPKQITIKGDALELEAKPLPAAGMPKSFAGAVGDYAMATSVKPVKVQAGDPITITAKITGRGNFDRVTAPQLSDPDGWRTYPPSGKFDADDDIGISGSKTFQMAVIPENQKPKSPRLEWSYFDPIKEQYVTLTDNGTPISVEGGFQPQQPTPAPVMAQAAPTPDRSKPDIQYIRADSSGWGESFEPIYESRIFWAAQGGPLIALLAFVGIQGARKRAANEEARRIAKLRREKESALAAMQHRDVSESELYQAAARALRIEAAIRLRRDPDTLDGTEVVTSRKLDPETAERVRRIFDQQDEVAYAGRSGGRGAAGPGTRVETLEIVKAYEHAGDAT